MMHDKGLRGVLLAAERGLNVGITLYLSGMIVSGLCISRKQWQEAYTQSFASSFQSGGMDDAAVLAWAVEQQLKIGTIDELPDDVVMIELVHLKDARVYLNAGPMPIESPYWRGNVASIAGWHFQQLMTTQVQAGG